MNTLYKVLFKKYVIVDIILWSLLVLECLWLDHII